VTTERVVIDASAFVEMLVDTELGVLVEERLRDCRLLAPANFDSEVLSSLGRLARAGRLLDRKAAQLVRRTAAAPVQRESVPALLPGAWRRRHNLRLVDGLYAELAHQLGDVPLVTTDHGLAAASRSADLVSAP
jgi:predicted nucleic acid-binding protein